jgi:hypothetical protein
VGVGGGEGVGGGVGVTVGKPGPGVYATHGRVPPVATGETG